MSYLILLICYLIGCFPSGILVARLHRSSIVDQGSGNVGATNVARVLGKRAGLLTLLLDITKGSLGSLLPVIAVNINFLAAVTNPELATWNLERLSHLAGVCTVAGHCFSLPGAKGGKGVATALGVILALTPWTLSLGVLASFVVVFYWSRIVSLSSLTAATAAPILAWFSYQSITCPLLLSVITLIIWLRHHQNIARLIRGEEKMFTLKKSLEK